MEFGLVRWGQAVKQRRGGTKPVLWLFTDDRLANPLAAAGRLPKGLGGVVVRDPDPVQRARLGAALAKICRARRLELVVAGDLRLAAKLAAGVHLRGGRWPGVLRRRGLITSSAHDRAEVRRARRAGAGIIFLSPAFATASHPGAAALGPARWVALARGAGGATPVYALGGVTGGGLRRLGGRAAGAGGVSAFA